MNVLIACEESQAVCKAFRKKGHNAFSCDIIECSGGHPEWHIKGDVTPLLNREDDGNNGWHYIYFNTMDGKQHCVERWDMIIAFPPCTYLTVTGNRWFDVVKYGRNAQIRWNARCRAICFFLRIAFSDCDKIIIENPIGCMSTYFRKPDQIVHPYMFGDPARKATCFWLKGVPPLKPTNIVEPEIVKYKNGKGTDSPWHMETMSLPPDERAKARSKTFPGMADAMGDQWG